MDRLCVDIIFFTKCLERRSRVQIMTISIALEVVVWRVVAHIYIGSISYLQSKQTEFLPTRYTCLSFRVRVQWIKRLLCRFGRGPISAGDLPGFILMLSPKLEPATTCSLLSLSIF